jgi:hypothetical protein
MEVDSLYWQAVAQIIPVVALALVIEGRVLAEPWEKKPTSSFFASMWRMTVSYYFLALGVVLLLTELAALYILAVPDIGLRLLFIPSLFTVGAGLATVIGLPLIRFYANA